VPCAAVPPPLTCRPRDQEPVAAAPSGGDSRAALAAIAAAINNSGQKRNLLFKSIQVSVPRWAAGRLAVS
jgi:hypothetical protein